MKMLRNIEVLRKGSWGNTVIGEVREFTECVGFEGFQRIILGTCTMGKVIEKLNKNECKISEWQHVGMEALESEYEVESSSQA